MTDSIKATRATVQIGALTVDGFMLPDGSYRMSQTQAAETVGLSERNAREFLQSNAVKALLGEGYTPAISEIESDPNQGRGQSRFRALPLETVSAYWMWQAYRGNKKALTLCMALILETLERRFDNAFGISRTEQERDDRLSARVSQLQSDLDRLGEGFAIDADKDREIAYLTSLLKDNGIEPYGLPSGDHKNNEGAK
ncbi:KilA-N DNA-binding domain-containing protein [Tumidithrix helvetica PCC 7403]|uniref:hypothetical protein n=1 Tax=Tumidithrix helvetica TaxID=3457545 RepID=UPI003C8F761E